MLKSPWDGLAPSEAIASQLESESCDPMDYPVHNTGVGIAFPFCRGSSGPRNQTGVFRIAGGFFTNWAIRETQICFCILSCDAAAASPNPFSAWPAGGVLDGQ